MKIGREKYRTRKKPTPVPLIPPQIPHDLRGIESGPLRWKACDITGQELLSALYYT
jgi:hypothetical protein